MDAENILTTRDMKRFLLEEMVATAKGERESVQAKAICNYAQQIYNVANLEIKYASVRAKLGSEVGSVSLLEDNGSK